MQVFSRYILVLLTLASALSVAAQRFSEDKTEFRAQAISRLQAIGTEPAKKIAFDFKNAWDGKFTSLQQDKAHQIALRMQQKGYQFYPYFYHYFTYLAYSVAQENLQRDKLSKVLEINEQVVETLSKSEYQEFLFGLNIFFARRYLSLDKNLVVQLPDGSYNFDLLDDYVEIVEDEVIEEDTVAVVVAEEVVEEQPEEQGWGNDDSWDNSNDSWGDDSWGDNNDTWGNDDSWGDSDDSWGSSDDSWGNDSWGDDSSESSDTWGSDDSWESSPAVPEAPKAERPSYSPVTTDYLAKKKAAYVAPAKEGPVIELVGSRLLMATPYDSVVIKNMNGSFLLKDRTMTGTQGSLDWPPLNKNFRGATVQLKDFFIRRDRADFWTPNATLEFSEKVGGPVEGVFEYRSTPRPKRALNNYPIFTSNEADISIKLYSEKISYTGGIQLKGNRLFGKSVSRETGTVRILDGRGNTIVLKSKDFVLGDSLLSMDNGSISILHGTDSIFHESVRAKYDVTKEEFKALRNTTTKPFQSSYFDVSMNVDLITWNMEVDSISMEIMNGKDLLPASFESYDFYDNFRYKKIARSLNFHPLNLAVHYAQKFGIDEFYVGELALEYEINQNFAKAAGKLLYQYGFADYDGETGLLSLYPKAFHYYNASARRVDYDNLMVPSKIKSGSNAYIQLDSGKLNIRGVSKFYITSDYKVYGQPIDSTVTLLEGRDLTFDGDLHAGDFDYQGVGHNFNYEEFLVNMPQIDSMRITVPLQDTTKVDEGFKQTELANQITGTSGTLFIDKPENKSGKEKNGSYPLFASDSEAVVYFDGPEILGGAYDKSVRFLIPPFKLDSLEREDGESISFEGTFNSGGVFPSFDETLHVQEDKSLGFIHQIPEEGYNLYGTEAKTYEEIRLSNSGMRGYGQIDFLTTTIYSDDFIYYPDSVTSQGTSGVISPGNYKGASYPEAVLGIFNMYWLPRKDSMYLRTVSDPFKFYNATAELEGYATITTNGVYGGGKMLTRGSEAVSDDMSFTEFEYGARNASFLVLTDDPEKPAMEGDDIRLDFDLTTNTAVVRPERAGVAAISFPYAQMKTSITEAVWDLEDSVVTMIKSPLVAIEDSYFFSTRKELDSLAFNAEKATYDINTQELEVEGIPFIIVADTRIVPEGNKTVVYANSELKEFTNAEIIIDTLNGYHYLDRANIRILSRNKFEGNAYYKQIVNKDTFDIRFDSFELQEVPVGEPDKKGVYPTRLMTVSGGEVPESTKLRISPGFMYKGSVIMYASKPALELDGLIQLDFKDPEYNEWIQFQRTEGERDVRLVVDNAVFDGGLKVNLGIHQNLRDEYYVTFAEQKQESADKDIFVASGELSFNDSLKYYVVETPSKTNGTTYAGSTMIYNEESGDIVIEGPINFIDPTNTQIQMKSSFLGAGNRKSMELKGDAMIAIDIPSAPPGALDEMIIDLTDIIERIGPPTANKINTEFLYNLGNTTSDKIAKDFEEASLKEYTALAEVSREIEKTLFISSVKMQWNQEQKAWHNTTKIGISNVLNEDINAKLEGFLEIKKDETGADVLNLFMQPAPGIWYYFGYSVNQLIMYSSNSKFNEAVQSKSNVDNAKPGELVLAVGTVNETLGFINDFRLNFFGIKEPYNLVSPDDISTEDESFDTVEEDDDDGFGFE